MSGVFGDTCESFSSFFVEVFMMVGWVLNICLDEVYLKRGRRKQDLNPMLPYKQKRLEREMDKRRCIDKTVLIRPARHMVCLFASSGQCQDMHAAFEFLFAPPNWSDFVNWISVQSTVCSHEACKAQSHVAVQAEERVEREWKISDMSLYVRCVLWFLRIYFVFFVEVFMMVGWVLNICLDEFYLKRGRRKQDINLMLPYKQKRLEREMDKRRCLIKLCWSGLQDTWCAFLQAVANVKTCMQLSSFFF